MSLTDLFNIFLTVFSLEMLSGYTDEDWAHDSIEKLPEGIFIQKRI